MAECGVMDGTWMIDKGGDERVANGRASLAPPLPRPLPHAGAVAEREHRRERKVPSAASLSVWLGESNPKQRSKTIKHGYDRLSTLKHAQARLLSGGWR